ncbi:MAG: glycosyltransferase family 4 protein [Fibrobacter sp.]|nr:glycosyltransferase family 4 protein [Fibrobacter sp.]
MYKVLIVATSHKTRGGVTSVVNAHKQGAQWEEYHCKWIETHIDKGLFTKFLKVIPAFIQYLFLLPFYSLVHIHMSEPPSALRKIAFMWWAKVWRKKTIVHFHSFSVDTTINSRYSKLYKYLFSRADRVIVLSEYWKVVVEQFLPSAKVQVIYNPCTAQPDSNAHVTKKNSILYAGTVCHRKGYDDMIKAFAKIAKNHPDWKIVFAGNGEIEQGKALANELNINDQVVWLGWVRGADKDKAFREATVFCLPSYAEGFPMSVLDAWSYGLPVITTPVGGIPDVAKNGENMLLFNPGDIDALANCMERIISNEELRESISKESLNFAETTFNMATINKEIGELYQSLLTVHNS